MVCSIYHQYPCPASYTIPYNITQWSVDVLVCRRFGVLTFWPVDVLVCRRFGLSTFWFVDVLVCRRFGLSTFWSVDVSVCRRFDQLPIRPHGWPQRFTFSAKFLGWRWCLISIFNRWRHSKWRFRENPRHSECINSSSVSGVYFISSEHYLVMSTVAFLLMYAISSHPGILLYIRTWNCGINCIEYTFAF